MYRWNSAITAAFWEPIGHLEVALRNTLDGRLAARHQGPGRAGSWLDDSNQELSSRAPLRHRRGAGSGQAKGEACQRRADDQRAELWILAVPDHEEAHRTVARSRRRIPSRPRPPTTYHREPSAGPAPSSKKRSATSRSPTSLPGSTASGGTALRSAPTGTSGLPAARATSTRWG
jgi:hypothetical protein